MKYQITCDNCSTQFIVEAGEGQTIECTCPHCKGIMEVTLPLVSAGQQYRPQNLGALNQSTVYEAKVEKKKHPVLWGVVIGLLIVVVAGASYLLFRPSAPVQDPQTAAPVDTIPYDTPQEDTPAPSIDTVVVPHIEDIPQEEIPNEENVPEEPTDSTVTDGEYQ